MNKKQRNRKEILKNKRNRIINRRYSSTIKTLFKLFLQEWKNFKEKQEFDSEKKLKIKNLINNLFSIIDKAHKKNVIHKNNAARKKSKISKLAKQFLF